MKILHILRAPVGGLFRHVVDLARGQIARGHEVGIIADSTTGNAGSEHVLAGLRPQLALGLSRIPMARHPAPSDLGALWKISKLVRNSSAQILHGHGAKGGAVARLAMAPRGAVRVYTPHGGSLHDAIGNRLHIALEKVLKPCGDLYLFESDFSRKAYLRKVGYPRGVVNVVHNGIAACEFEPVALDGSASDIVFVGELRALKGVDVLIDAIALLRDRGIALTASLVGDGPNAAELRAQVDHLGLDRSIRFCGMMPTRKALAQGRLVVVPSRAESLPYIVLEAAVARPLIATRVGGIPEIFGPLANRLVAPDDPAALAHAIAGFQENPQRGAESAKDLQSRIAEGFALDSMVASIMEAYEAAIVQKRDVGYAPNGVEGRLEMRSNF
ncbi:MAG TPA: glycosyltransferase family 4 protein [Candidatus Binataceae bacterium]